MVDERDITLDCQASKYQNNGRHQPKEPCSNKFYNLNAKMSLKTQFIKIDTILHRKST